MSALLLIRLYSTTPAFLHVDSAACRPLIAGQAMSDYLLDMSRSQYFAVHSRAIQSGFAMLMQQLPTKGTPGDNCAIIGPGTTNQLAKTHVGMGSEYTRESVMVNRETTTNVPTVTQQNVNQPHGVKTNAPPAANAANPAKPVTTPGVSNARSPKPKTPGYIWIIRAPSQTQTTRCFPCWTAVQPDIPAGRTFNTGEGASSRQAPQINWGRRIYTRRHELFG